MLCNAGQRAGSGAALPFGPCLGIAFPHDATELTRRCCQRCDFGRTAVELIQEGPCLFGLLQPLSSSFARRDARWAGLGRLLLFAFSSAPVLLLQSVAKCMGAASEALCMQFAPELRGVVASLLPTLLKILATRFHGRASKASLAFGKSAGSEPTSDGLPAQTTSPSDLPLG